MPVLKLVKDSRYTVLNIHSLILEIIISVVLSFNIFYFPFSSAASHSL